MLTKPGIIYNIHFIHEYAENMASLYLGIFNIAVMFVVVTVGFYIEDRLISQSHI